MSLLDKLGGLLTGASGGNLSEQDAHQHYDQLAQQVPPETLGGRDRAGLANLGGAELQQRVTNSATQMDPQQRGNLMQSLLGGLGGSGSNIGSLLGQLGINQSVANNPQSATPDEVGKLAAHAQATNPGLFQEAMSFYSQHPTLVKALGAAVIAGIASHLGKGLH